MPSRGSPVVKFRCLPDLLREIEQTIDRRNFWSDDEPWTLSTFLQIAAREKLAKMARSRLRKRSAGSRTSGGVRRFTKTRIAPPTDGDARQ